MIPEPDRAALWWQDLKPDPDRDHRGDRAALARLRRADSIAAAMMDPATLDLFRRCAATHLSDLPKVALVAGVLAHVREDNRAMLVARQIGPTETDRPETAAFKPLRFRRLIEADDPEECLIAFRRMVGIADRQLHVPDLARALAHWTDRLRGPEIKRRWIFAYWNATLPAADTAASIPSAVEQPE